MTKKLFISYSHFDESHRVALEDHLTMLKRQDIISVWHDRKIIPGDEWKDCIDNNIESADIILFLISTKFLASSYCFDVEVKKAMERHAKGTAKIISIILKPCDWHACEFSKFQVVPKDALPITQWSDSDNAWLDVINGLKKTINEFTPLIQVSNLIKAQERIEVSLKYKEWLNDTEIVLVHRKIDKVDLSDIYVSLDIEFDDSKKKETKTKSSNTLFTKQGYYLIYGEEQQGKTTLLKHAFIEFLKKEYLPIYVDAKNVKNSDLNKLLRKSVEEQYSKFGLPPI